jgi:hypothetical protein
MDSNPVLLIWLASRALTDSAIQYIGVHFAPTVAIIVRAALIFYADSCRLSTHSFFAELSSGKRLRTKRDKSS